MRRVVRALSRTLARAKDTLRFLLSAPPGTRVVIRPRRLREPRYRKDISRATFDPSDRLGLRVARNVGVVSAASHVMRGSTYYGYTARAVKLRKEPMSSVSLVELRIPEAFVNVNQTVGNYFHSVFERGFAYFLMSRRNADLPVLWIGPLKSFEREMIEVLTSTFGIKFIVAPETVFCRVDKAYTLDVDARSLFSWPETLQAQFKDYVDRWSRIRTAGTAAASPDKIYSIRTGARRVFSNDADVSKVFLEFGYTEIDFVGTSVRDSAAIVKGARVIAGGHGANLTNLVFLSSARSPIVFEISSKAKTRNRTFEWLCKLLRLNYRLMVVEDDLYVDPVALRHELQGIEECLRQSTETALADR